MKKPMPMKANKMKMRFGAPVAKAAKGGFLGGMGSGMAAGYSIAEDGKERREKREQARMSKEGIYKRGGMVMKSKVMKSKSC